MKRRVVIATIIVVAAAAVLSPYSPALWLLVTKKTIKVQRHPNEWEIVETNRFGADKGHWNGAYQFVEYGVVRTEGFWANSHHDGLWTHYAEDGQTIEYQTLWKDGKALKHIHSPPWRKQ